MPAQALADATLDEPAARRVWLADAVERDDTVWGPADRRWADQATAQAVADDAPDTHRYAERAELVLRRAGPRVPGLDQAAGWRLWHPGWGIAAALAGLALGALSESVLAGPFVNLLSLPLFGLLAWNLGVMLALALAALGRRAPGSRSQAAAGRAGGSAAGPAVALLGRLARPGAWSRAGGTWPEVFVRGWQQASRALVEARVGALLHLAAAALAAGVVAGWYTRALVFDYRAGWASTLLDAELVQPLLAWVLAPASALSGLPLPDLAGVQALQVTPARPAAASAAVWLHLMALTLVLAVVLPRAALAAACAWRAARRAEAVPLPPSCRPRPAAARGVAAGPGCRWWVLPHAEAPDERARAGWQALADEALGAGARLNFAQPLRYGDETAAALRRPAGTTAVVLVDLGATPEDEVHGRLLEALGPPSQLWLDATGFVRRFGAGRRLEERRQAWQAFAQARGVACVVADLGGAPAGGRPGDDSWALTVSVLRAAADGLRG